MKIDSKCVWYNCIICSNLIHYNQANQMPAVSNYK